MTAILTKKTVLIIGVIISTLCDALPLTDEQTKLRQDIDVGGLGGGEDGLVEIGTQVGQIVNGVFTGNVGDIFAGTLPFIDDSDTAAGVGTIFQALTQPLNTLWAQSNKQSLKYFGITEATTANPNKQVANNGTIPIGTATILQNADGSQQLVQVQQPGNGLQQQAQPVQILSVIPAAVAATTESKVIDEDDDSDTENRLKI